MHEISVLALRSDGDAGEQWMRPARVERIPTHVRDFQIRVRGCDPFDLARDPAQTLRHLIFAAALGHKLHADADPEERPATRTHALVERLHHAVESVEPAPAIGEGADARQHHALCAGDLLPLGRHNDRLRQPFPATCAPAPPSLYIPLPTT